MDSQGHALARTGAAALAAVAAWAILAASTGAGAAPDAHAGGPGARFALDGPRGTIVHRNLRFGPLGASLDLYRRAGYRHPLAAVVVVHGGGWSGGGKRRMAPISLALARAGFAAFNVGYTLAEPGRPGVPGQPLQLRAAVRWIRRHAGALGVDRRRIGALGSSAGGHLAGLLATQGDGPLSTGGRVGAVVSWSAPFDLPALSGHHLLGPAARMLVGCGLAFCPGSWTAASPIAHVTPGDPPMLLVNSLREMVPADQAERMADTLSAAGVPHELRLLDGHRHGREYAAEATEPSLAFLRRWLLP